MNLFQNKWKTHCFFFSFGVDFVEFTLFGSGCAWMLHLLAPAMHFTALQMKYNYMEFHITSETTKEQVKENETERASESNFKTIKFER